MISPWIWEQGAFVAALAQRPLHRVLLYHLHDLSLPRVFAIRKKKGRGPVMEKEPFWKRRADSFDTGIKLLEDNHIEPEK